MKVTEIYGNIKHRQKQGRKSLAVLIDPDKATVKNILQITALSNRAGVDYFFVGSSFLVHDHFEKCVHLIKSSSEIPVILFPGSHLQVSDKADAILLLSMISGRNPELLIGQHVLAAPALKRSGLEIIPTGYMLIDGGVLTSASYVSNTIPIPSNKNDIAISTAMAGEMLGLHAVYLDAGSGARKPVPVSMIAAVRKNMDVPLIVGGGIKDPETASKACKAGADVIVTGNIFETDPDLITGMAHAVHEAPLPEQA